MTNDFIKNGEPVYGEALNGAILIFNTLSPQFTLNLPSDYDNGVFALNEQKVDFVLVNIFCDDNTEINSNKLALKGGATSGVVTVRIYPNIQPFKSWGSLSWTQTATTGTITCQLLKQFGVTLVDSNYTSGEDMSAKGLVLEYVDFQFTLTAVSGNSPTLNTLSLIFNGGN